MIVDLLSAAVLAGLTALLSLLPTFSMPSAALYDGFLGDVGKVDHIFPIITLLQCLTVLLAVELLMRSWDVIVWIYHQIWGGD